MDKIHCSWFVILTYLRRDFCLTIPLLSNSWFICVYYALSPTLCCGRSCYWIFNGVSRHCSQAMDRRCLLLHANSGAHHLSVARFCMEVVSTFNRDILIHYVSELYSSYQRTYWPQPYHIAQEIQKYNIPDYRPRQEQ